MMRRRRLLQTISVGLTAGAAGCNRLKSDTDTTSTTTPTPTSTKTRTATDTREYAPGDLTVPSYIELLPQKHLRGIDQTGNSNFTWVDWEWYMWMIDTEMRFGAAKNEDWTLAPNQGNLFRPPKYDLIHTPLGATIQVAEYLILNVIGEGFPNAGPEILNQTGLNAEPGQREKARDVDDVIAYASPGITMFIGADLSSFREAVTKNPLTEDDRYPDTVVYSGVENASSRNIIVSEALDRDIIAVESGDEDPESLTPLFVQLAGEGESVVVNEPVQWCLSKLRPGMPIVHGEINEGRINFDESPYSNREVQRLPEFDAIFYGFDTTGETGMGQAVTSRIQGPPPGEADLREVYGSPDGQVTTSANENVSEITVTWGPQQLSRPGKALSDIQL